MIVDGFMQFEGYSKYITNFKHQKYTVSWNKKNHKPTQKFFIFICCKFMTHDKKFYLCSFPNQFNLMGYWAGVLKFLYIQPDKHIFTFTFSLMCLVQSIATNNVLHH